MLEVLGFLQVKFYLISGLNLDTSDTLILIQTRPNAFRILIENSSRPLLPLHYIEYNNCDKL